MNIANIKIGEKYTLSHKVTFYESRSGMFAYFDKDLVVEVTKTFPDSCTQTCMVKFPGALFEVRPSILKERQA